MGKYFGSSGIRGVYSPDKLISNEFAYRLGKAVSEYTSSGRVIIGRDSRLSGPSLRKALIKGLEGCEIIDTGVVPTPVLSYAVKELRGDLGIMITASHNTAEYNGFKIWDSGGRAMDDSGEKSLEACLDETKGSCQPLFSRQNISEVDIDENYISSVLDKISLSKKKKVLIDCANGAACDISPRLLKRYGLEVVEVNCQFDGSFPSRNPEPIADNLKKTGELVVANNCEIGFAHDGDADRVVAIDEKGRTVDFDSFLAFFSEQSYKQKSHYVQLPSVVTTVDASMVIENYLSGYHDLKVIRTKVGDVFVADAVQKNKSIFGGEPCGAYILPEFSYAPDGVYSMVKLLEFLEKQDLSLSQLLDLIKKPAMVRTKISCPQAEKPRVMDLLKEYVPVGTELITIDGLLLKGDGYMALIRPSSSEEIIRLNVESDDEGLMKHTMEFWKRNIEELLR